MSELSWRCCLGLLPSLSAVPPPPWAMGPRTSKGHELQAGVLRLSLGRNRAVCEPGPPQLASPQPGAAEQLWEQLQMPGTK